MNRPSRPVAITCGEPAGIGPEIAARAWAALSSDIPMFWIGDPRHLPEDVPHRLIDSPEDVGAPSTHALPVLSHVFESTALAGVPQPGHAQGVIDVIARAVDLVQTRAACAICTAPIHKKALQDGANFAYPGHTEYLAALAGVEDVVMMLASDRLRVVPATIHIALDQVPLALTPAGLRRTIEITAQELQNRFGITRPRIAVAGLNPHAGEGGSMGRQELDWIAPLILEMQGEGHALTGPLPADTMFHARARAGYDAAVAMYHDQALIPIKTLDFDRGVNVTLGLPFVRTSPDHGTAFDIAGQGRANPTSMIEAIKLAWQMGQKT
ncbi:4-hydroxythreonine-4-phosphate dehydrogenase [Sulfitobacter sp. DSM 110093]|uniref:4-hydroxythreonine-4-phosphate dehydrogenase PdxA n=1 Tax=Sulfitobacter sp. DSM 110093 TaxID=2883127 RepID=UPI001FACE551|nr:4-hydroxythreonine-4-phosphate dehydrogenase PdxA [Sulfitobacter sp. DSM 110093]UOA31828.1 4-hydroxythreonine-4-phosphate dehydrogenase [Sulfitobacter sp. DSM 110093]